MKALLDDLLDFARTQLGEGINIVPAPIDVAKLFAGEVEQLRAAYPDVRLELEVIGESQGLWDGLRLQQLLGNLVVNAIKYGAPDTPVRVRVVGQGNELHFEVRNFGPSIEQSTLDEIFEPLKRGPHRASRAAVTVAAGTNAPNSVPSASASAPCAGPNAVAVLSTINASLIKLE